MRRERGMVTTEIALGSLIVVLLLSLAGWMLATVFTVDRCQLAADAIARQHARGDDAAVKQLSTSAPDGARVEVRRSNGASTVQVSYTPVFLGLPTSVITVSSTVLDEARP